MDGTLLTLADVVEEFGEPSPDGVYPPHAERLCARAIEQHQLAVRRLSMSEGGLSASDQRSLDRFRGNLRELELAAPHYGARQRVADRNFAAVGGSGGGSTAGQQTRGEWLADVFRAQVDRDPAAGERLRQHGERVRQALTARGVEVRALASSASGAFIVPSVLGEWAETRRPSRTVAPLMRQVPLPATGMSVKVPKVTTGPAVDVQGVEGGVIANVDMVGGEVEAPVTIVAGRQRMTRDAVDRSAPALLDVVLTELDAAYDQRVDELLIAGTGSNRQPRGVLNTTGTNTIAYTDGTPSASELYPRLAVAIGAIASGYHAGADAIVMHPRRWSWLLGSLDTTNRPWLVPAAGGYPSNAGGVATDTAGPTSVGWLLGLPVYVTPAVPTNRGAGSNEDAIIIGAWNAAMFMEDPGNTIRFDSPDDLTVAVAEFGYVAATFERHPAAFSIVGGTGLVAPS